MKSLQTIWQLKTDTSVIVDVDTGIDDAMALILLRRWLGDRIIGLTTTGGNVEIGKVIHNTLGLTEYLKWDVPVYAGAEKPLRQEQFTHAPEFHGQNGLAERDLPTTKVVSSMSASDAIIAALEKGPLIVIALGPAVNIAQALIARPELSSSLTVVMMGGALAVPGNHDQYSEFNFYQDPDSVKTIWESCDRVAVIPLDVTHQCLLTLAEVAAWPATSETDLMKDLITRWYEFFGTPRGRTFELYDPLAASALTQSYLSFDVKRLEISCTTANRGQVLATETGRSIMWANQVDSKSFKRELF
jgi:purine nucleosidase